MSYKYSDEFKAILEEIKINKNIAEESYIRTYQPRTNHFIEFLGENKELKNRRIEDFSINDIQSYFNDISDKLKWNTISSTYHVLRTIFDYLYENKGNRDIFKGFDVNSYKSEQNSSTVSFIVSNVDVSKLYNFIYNQENLIEDRLLLALILQNGLSKGEIKNLRRCDIDFDERHLYVATNKNREKVDKTILADDVMLLIRAYIQKSKPSYYECLFKLSSSGLETNLKKITKKVIQKELTYTQTRDIFRYHIIKKYKSNVYLISKLFNETVGRTEDIINTYKIFTNEDIEEDIRHLLNEFNDNMK